MRKVLSFVLVLALVLSSFSMAFAGETTTTTAKTTSVAATLTDIDGLACKESVKVLVDLGVITGYADGTFKPTNTVTRAEAAVIVIKALGLEKSVGTQKSSYKDMAGYGWAEGYVAFASTLGILEGYGDGTFKPGNVVSYNEMAAILVRSLGYTTQSLTGVWPANYVNKAAGLGIMDDVVSGGNNGATRADVAVMTANNLTNYVGTIDKDGNFQATILSGSVAKNNAVYDNYVQRLGGEEKTEVIVSVEDALINATPYLGKYCTYYVNSDDEILAVSEVKSTTIDGTVEDKATPTVITADDVDYTLPSGYAYTDEDDNSWASEVITNGKVDSTTVSALTRDTDYKLEVKLSGKKIKEVYSVSTWEVNGAAKVIAGDLADLKDAELLGYDFETNKNDEILTNTFELVGATSLDKIKADDIVYVYATKDSDKFIRKVAVGTEVVEGKVVKTNATDKEWKIGTKTYAFAAAGTQGADAYADELDSDVKVWLDAYGDIYKYDATGGSADNYAVVKGTTSIGNLKLYLADDTTKVFDTDLDSAEEAILAGLTTPWGQLVGYGLNKDGDVDSLSTTHAIAAGSDAKLLSDKVIATTTGGLETRYTIESDVTVFTVNGTTYDVAKIADLEKEDAYRAGWTLYLDKDGHVAAMIAPDAVNNGSETSSYAVISAADSAVNAAGDKAYELTGFIDGKKMNDTFTSNKDVVNNVASYTGVNVYEIKYNDDKNISKLTPITGTQATTTLAAAASEAFQYVTDGYLKLGTTSAAGVETYAVAKDAKVYSVEFDGAVVDEYSTFGGTIKAGENVWLYNFDDDDSEYDVVIIERL